MTDFKWESEMGMIWNKEKALLKTKMNQTHSKNGYFLIFLSKFLNSVKHTCPASKKGENGGLEKSLIEQIINL